MFHKKEKAEKKPEFVKDLNNSWALNYEVYYLKPLEKILFIILGLVIGAGIGYLFFGGLGKDDYGQATTTTYVLDIVVCGIGGLIAVKFLLPMRTNQVLAKRKKELRRQFRELLDTLTTSISAGMNSTEAFLTAHKDLGIVYSEDDYIMKELNIIRKGFENGFQIEKLLLDFGERSGIDDIKSFADVFKTTNSLSGNLRDVIKTIQSILSDKMNVEEEIETVVSASAMEQKIMLVMPVFIVAMIKFSDKDFASNFATATGVISTVIAVVLFGLAYLLGKKMLNIKV